MKKTLRAIALATIVTASLMLSFVILTPAHAEEYGEFYPKLTVVFDTEYIGDTNCRVIYCVDKGFNVWSFFDDSGEWNKGDLANLLMWNTNEDEELHEIVEVYWTGYTKDIDQFMQMNGWE